MKEKKDTKTISYKEMYGDFECPDCQRSTEKGDNIYDAGNGFCQDCASDH